MCFYSCLNAHVSVEFTRKVYVCVHVYVCEIIGHAYTRVLVNETEPAPIHSRFMDTIEVIFLFRQILNYCCYIFFPRFISLPLLK